MQTNFTPEQLQDPAVANSEQILRKCVHCGFCTATCPTFTLLGDELDSPRGRIYLIKEMLENDRPADARTVKHIDRCLSCLACMTTCPSGVNYMHLVDHARTHIEKTYKRPFHDRVLRSVLANILPYPARFRWALRAARVSKPFAGLFRKLGGPFGRLGAMLDLAPSGSLLPSRLGPGQHYPELESKKGRVALLKGCAQPVLKPSINEATVRLLTRLGYEVASASDEGCCGALVHHMGREDDALDSARRNVDAWIKQHEREPLEAIVITASGCGTTIKDYGFMLRNDPQYKEKAAMISSLAVDITEFLSKVELGLPRKSVRATVAYHSACSMQHGQKITSQPKQLLTQAGFKVKDVPEGHLCCGSAGTYNIMQPQIAEKLKERKLANISRTRPDLIATGNIGCITQLSTGADVPVVHTVELLDWVYGGPMPNGCDSTLA